MGSFVSVLAKGGGRFGGELRSARGRGWDREKTLLAWPTPTRWRLRVAPDLPGGRRGYPSSLLAAYWKKPFAAVSSSSRPFLEVLIGTSASESRSLVGDLQWTQRSRGFVVFVDPPLSTFVSLLFLFLSFGRACVVSAPAPIIGCIGWLFWNKKREKILFL